MSPIIALTLVAIFCRVKDTLAATSECATYSVQNRVLKRHAFVTKPTQNIEDCVISCIKHPSCQSSNYYRKKKMCELNDKTDISNPEDMMEVENANYMTNGVRFPPGCSKQDSECGRPGVICPCKEASSQLRDTQCKGSKTTL